MSRAEFSSAPDQAIPPEPPLGIIAALGMGWRLMLSDFWFFWGTVALAMLIGSAAGIVPFGSFVAGPPLAAGVVYVYMRRIDGVPVTVGKIFEGFSRRFGESILAMLPLLAISVITTVVLIVAVVSLIWLPLMKMNPATPPDFGTLMPAIVALNSLSLAVEVPVWIAKMFFVFAPIAVWDFPHAGWEAAKLSMRLVVRHIGPMIGLLVLAWLILTAATILGLVACCVGLVFTYPFAMGWMAATAIYLYRSWTGQPLVQPQTTEPQADVQLPQ